ncbi:MAG TPA: DUF488 domain-containing protein, partial [Streptosporangiaceae bacterium]|nr:DUF488 domain-containing protein [Streptosporangiaceae bacterium]
STHPVDALAGLLRGQRIDVLADIRSMPYSRHNPQFRKENLRASIEQAGLRYVWLGAELGGRPPEPEFYDSKGHARYDLVAETERFQAGLERLLTGAASYRVAIMCSEEDPARCHRRLLVTRALVGREVEVRHIRGNGSVVTEADLSSGEAADPGQPALFD